MALYTAFAKMQHPCDPPKKRQESEGIAGSLKEATPS